MPLLAPAQRVDTFTRRSMHARSGFSPYSTAYPQPLEAFWAGDPQQAAYANGAAVSSWRNGGSRGSGPLTQATGANQPTYRTSGIGLRPSLSFDGGDNIAVAVSNIAQPYKVIAVGRFSNLGSSRGLTGLGVGANSRLGVNGAGQWIVNAGGTSFTDGAADTNPHVFRLTLNGASSQLWIDGVSVSTGAGGSAVLSNFIVGAASDGSVGLIGDAGFVGIYDGAVSDAALAVLEADLIAHYSFNPLTQVPGLLHGVWADDPAWTRPADGAGVASWRNGSGGGDPAQATGGFQPLMRYVVAGLNNRGAVEFDGTDDFLDFDIANMVQPFKVVAVAKLTTAAATTRLFLGSGGSQARGIGQQGSASGLWYQNYGTVTSGSASNTNGHVFRSTINGASSSLAIDRVPDIVADAGTDGQFRFTVGSGSDATLTYSRYWLGHIAFIGIFPGTTSDADLQVLESNLRQYYQTA